MTANSPGGHQQETFLELVSTGVVLGQRDPLIQGHQRPWVAQRHGHGHILGSVSGHRLVEHSVCRVRPTVRIRRLIVSRRSCRTRCGPGRPPGAAGGVAQPATGRGLGRHPPGMSSIPGCSPGVLRVTEQPDHLCCLRPVPPLLRPIMDSEQPTEPATASSPSVRSPSRRSEPWLPPAPIGRPSRHAGTRAGPPGRPPSTRLEPLRPPPRRPRAG